ncbi:hypothetical protein F2Q70_00015763 [Brassica cretica]|uniref:Uncharacterized protein n=1 Tax=Brassica cretica TaxID=69181 RepID=A0A3N6R879_BRACR|nr:hypothetical protein F2Q70_00015763 [Brassica cretica]
MVKKSFGVVSTGREKIQGCSPSTRLIFSTQNSSISLWIASTEPTGTEGSIVDMRLRMSRLVRNFASTQICTRSDLKSFAANQACNFPKRFIEAFIKGLDGSGWSRLKDT